MDKQLFGGLATVNLDYLAQTVVPQIGNEYAQQAVLAVLDKLKESALVLTDDDPQNKEQMKRIWGTFTSDPRVAEVVETSLVTAISKIKDESIKEGLTLITPEIVKTVQGVTDNVPQDGDQLETIWRGFLQSDRFFTFMLKNVKFILERLKLPNWLKNIVQSILNTK